MPALDDDEILDLSTLDLGIRRTVAWLLAAGFDTIDSGDGVSKPAAVRAMVQEGSPLPGGGASDEENAEALAQFTALVHLPNLNRAPLPSVSLFMLEGTGILPFPHVVIFPNRPGSVESLGACAGRLKDALVGIGIHVVPSMITAIYDPADDRTVVIVIADRGVWGGHDELCEDVEDAVLMGIAILQEGPDLAPAWRRIWEEARPEIAPCGLLGLLWARPEEAVDCLPGFVRRVMAGTPFALAEVLWAFGTDPGVGLGRMHAALADLPDAALARCREALREDVGASEDEIAAWVPPAGTTT